MPQLVKPHGADKLNPLLLQGAALSAAKARAATLPKLKMSSRETGDLIMLGIGGFTPLTGFMGKADWQSVCDKMQLANGLFWPIPITLSASAEFAESLSMGSDIALVHADSDELMGILNLAETYRIDKTHECQAVFKTTDEDHPGVLMVMQQGAVNLGGQVQVFSTGGFEDEYGEQFMTPAQTRAYFEQKGWRKVSAFQTRNPMHRSHEYLVKIALETGDGVLVHSLLGKVKPGDIPAPVRTKAISALLENYFLKDTVLQAGYPLDMRYAGPREALLHALFRQNYGCSQLIVGRDHAGVGRYYGPFDAQHIFDEIPADALQIQPLKIDWTFWCNRCDGMASMSTCPHSAEDRVLISGTSLREALSKGEEVSTKFSRPEVLAILREYYQQLNTDK